MLIGLLGMSSIGLAKEDTWVKKSDMPTARLYFSTSEVNGKIYAIGGLTQNPQGIFLKLSTVEEYDPVINKWAKKANMPTERAGLDTSVVNGKIYAIGGYSIDWGKCLPTVEEYDPATDTWTRKADMPTARCWLSTSVVNERIYAICGWTGSNYTSAVEEYNPMTDTWTKKADLPTLRYQLSTSTASGKIYIIGGCHPQELLSKIEEYDPVTEKVTVKADMPTARAGLSASVVHRKIYAIGGSIMQGDWFKPITIVEEYDPAMDTWRKKAEMSTARYYLSSSSVDGKIYAIGGVSDNVGRLSTVEEYDSATDTWTKKTHMPTARYGFSTSTVDGKIYAIGGKLYLPTVEEYDTGFTGKSVEPKGKLTTTWGKVKAAY